MHGRLPCSAEQVDFLALATHWEEPLGSSQCVEGGKEVHLSSQEGTLQVPQCVARGGHIEIEYYNEEGMGWLCKINYDSAGCV